MVSFLKMRWSIEKFNWDRAADEFLDIIEEVIAK